MIGTQMPDRVERAILEAFAGVGYEESLVEHNVDHSFAGQRLDPIQMAAFWKKPPDQFTSAVAVRWMADSESSIREIKTLGTQLWAPFGLIARPSHCELWDAFPLLPSKQPTIIEESIPYPDLTNKLKSYEHLLGREQVRHRKVQSRQFALYEGTSPNDVFLQWAFQPTQTVLKKLLRGLFEEFGNDDLGWPNKAEQVRLLLRFLAVRIAWDKGKLEGADRTSPEAVLEKALTYPTNLRPDPEGRDLRLAKQFVNSMPSVNLGIVDGGTLSQVLQMNGLTREMRENWKLFPTPADLAWQMVQAIPIKTIDENDLVVWDGTCGTGTLLVVAFERLRQLTDDHGISAQQVAEGILGNDQEPLLADLTRINLDIAAGDIDGQPWNISARDIVTHAADSFPRRPSIILGNPPFGASGRGEDYAINIIDTYLTILRPGGLISTIMPRTLLGATGKRARALRETLLNKLDFYEVWDAPQGFVSHTSSELAVISARKRLPQDNTRSPITWKILDPRRKKAPMVEVISSPDVWIHTPQLSIEPPLLVKLRALLGHNPTLSDLMHGNWITEGITPGPAGRAEILDHKEPEARPYLTGRTGMVPFNLSWQTTPRWIKYESPNIWRARRSHQDLFARRKVVLGRWASGGNPWVARAAIDDDGLYPSEDFIIIGPEPVFSSEFICGLLNSTLINCWLKLVNPSRTIRIEACRSIPMPKDSDDGSVHLVVKAAERIITLRRHCSLERESIPSHIQEEIIQATIALDHSVYDLYEIPDPVRKAIGDFFNWYEKPRPGFDVHLKEAFVFDFPSPTSIFTETQASRLRDLQELMIDRDLSKSEADEHAQLVAGWQDAYIAQDQLILNKKAHS